MKRLHLIATKNGNESYQIGMDTELVKKRLIKLLPRRLNASQSHVVLTPRGHKILREQSGILLPLSGEACEKPQNSAG
ncbi:MAG: hypothetical protein LBG61_06870 [Burkholderiales bacterium]|nr:hypothetical protein [Burkholderiales bacterium]